tara:strand:- start:2119 stop:4806 length:2688 start_codon:yes stop_codon:yes gene_type:complete
MFSLSLLKSPTSDDLLKEYRFILLEGIVTELMGNTILKGTYLSREEYVRIQNRIDRDNQATISLTGHNSAWDAGWRINKGKEELDYNVDIVDEKIKSGRFKGKTRKVGKSRLSRSQWRKIWDKTPQELPSPSKKLLFDEYGFPIRLPEFSDEVGRELFPSTHKTPYSASRASGGYKKWVMGDPTMSTTGSEKSKYKWIKNNKLMRAYNTAVRDEDNDDKPMDIERKLVNKWGNANKAKWQKAAKGVGQKELKQKIIDAIKNSVDDKNISDRQLFNDYKRDIKPLDTRRTGKEKEESQARFDEKRKKDIEELKQRRIEEREGRPQVEKDLLEILSRGKNFPIYNKIQEALTTAVHGKREDKAIPRQIEIITDIISEIQELPNVDRPAHNSNLLILERILEQLQAEAPITERRKTTTKRIDNTKVNNAARDTAKKIIVTNSSITFGRPFPQGRNPFNFSINAWNTFSKLSPLSIPLDDKFLTGKFAPIGEYWLQLVAKDILKLKEGQKATLVYDRLSDKSEVDKALNKIRPKPHYPPATSPAFQSFYTKYNKIYPDSNPDELSVFITTLVDKIGDKLTTTTGATEEEKQEKGVDAFLKFTNDTLPEIIKLVKEGISVNTKTGEITHNFVAAYKAKVDNYSNPNKLLNMVVDMANGKNVSNQLKGIEKSELKTIENKVQTDLIEKIPTGAPNAKSVLNYILNAHLEAYDNNILNMMLGKIERVEGDVTVTSETPTENIYDVSAREKGFENYADMVAQSKDKLSEVKPLKPLKTEAEVAAEEHKRGQGRFRKSEILKTDKGLILESINSKEKKRIKTLLQHADPTEYFGQDFLKLGELIDVMKKLGVVKGNVKLDKKIIRYDDKNLKVVKLASRLRKLYEGLYRDLRELVYPDKGGKLR